MKFLCLTAENVYFQDNQLSSELPYSIFQLKKLGKSAACRGWRVLSPDRFMKAAQTYHLISLLQLIFVFPTISWLELYPQKLRVFTIWVSAYSTSCKRSLVFWAHPLTQKNLIKPLHSFHRNFIFREEPDFRRGKTCVCAHVCLFIHEILLLQPITHAKLCFLRQLPDIWDRLHFLGKSTTLLCGILYPCINICDVN